MHLFNKCCVLPPVTCCYPQPQPYWLHAHPQAQFPYGRQALPYGQQPQYPAQQAAPLMENLPSRRSKG